MADEESVLRNHRIEWVPETTKGIPPTNPNWTKFSEEVTDVSWDPDPGTDERRKIGDPDVSTFLKGSETHGLTFTYDMYTFPVDGSGNPVSADAYALLRATDNGLEASHTTVVREENESIPAAETWNGSTSYDTRLFLVGLGCSGDTVAYNGDPGSDAAIVTELGYQAQKVRKYQIDQPPAATAITAVSSDAADDSQTLTLEDEDAGVSEDVSLNGTTAVTTTAETFADIDVAYLDAETVGDVTIAINDASPPTVTPGDTLTVLYGSDHYGGTEGDQGIPPLGTGSHDTSDLGSPENILGDTIERPSGTTLAWEINSVAFEVANNIENRARVTSVGPGTSPGDREPEVSATVVGPTESVKAADAALSVEEANIIWTLTGGTFQLDTATLMDAPGVDKSQGDASMALDETFRGKGVTVTAA